MPTRNPVGDVIGREFCRPREASEKLGVHYETVRAMVNRGVFTARRTTGRGRARPVWLYRDEVDAFAAAVKAGKDPEQAVLKLRLKKQRLTN